MFRRIAAPMALSFVLLAACSSGDGDGGEVPIADDPIPPAGDNPPEDPPPPPPEDPPGPPANNAPQFETSVNQSVNENLPWSMRIDLRDEDDDPLTITLIESPDTEFFEFELIEENAVSLTLLAPQDHERPQDEDGNNRFDVSLSATDGIDDVQATYRISINDVEEIFEKSDSVLIIGKSAYGGLGRSAVNLGDIDEDGRPDLLLGAPGQANRDKNLFFLPPLEDTYGEVFLLSGDSLAQQETLALAGQAGEGIWQLDGGEQEYHLSYNADRLGDLDGDGISDLLISRNEYEILLVSGADLAASMSSGGIARVDELSFATLTLPTNFFVEPYSIESVGDLNDDGLIDLAIGMRAGDLTEIDPSDIRLSDQSLIVLSGEGLSQALTSRDNVSVSELIADGLGGGVDYAYKNPRTGPVIAVGDIDGDGLVDIGRRIQWDNNSVGAQLYAGSRLLSFMQSGEIRDEALAMLTDRESFYVSLQHGNTIALMDRMVTPLGDVTGDGLDDFGFSWLDFQSVTDSAFIVKGRPDIFESDADLIDLTTRGDAILLEGNELSNLAAILPPSDGLHDALVLARQGSFEFSTEYVSVAPHEFPDGGTARVSLPIAGTGLMEIPTAYRSTSALMYSIGDLNLDGYGDFAVGHAVADPIVNGSSVEDAGVVWLLSGKTIFERRNRGETIDPDREHPIP